MSSYVQSILIGVSGILVIGGAVYFSKPRSVLPPIKTQQVTQNTQPTPEITPSDKTPTKDTPSDTIIDYLVDDLTKSESVAAEATINAVTPTQGDITIGTNF